MYILFYRDATAPVGQGLPLSKLHDHTQTYHSLQDSSGRVISPSQRPLPDNTQHSQQTNIPPVGFEPTISAGKWPQTHALDRAATGTGYGKIQILISSLPLLCIMKDSGFVSSNLIGKIGTFFCTICAFYRYVLPGSTFLTVFSLRTLLIKGYCAQRKHNLTYRTY